jgi:hypothetical protein
LGLLEQLKANNININTRVLQQTMQILGNKAAEDPGAYIYGLQAIKQLLAALQNGKQVLLADVGTAEAALQKLAAAPTALPQPQNAAPNNTLQQQYFTNLQKNSKQ